MEEVILSVPAISEPMTTSVAPHVSVPPIPVPISVNIPQSGGSAVDMEFRETWERVQALRKPYPGAPNVTSVGGSARFNLISLGQATQPKMPQFFTMGTSTSLGLSPPEVVVKYSTKMLQRPNLCLKAHQVGITRNYQKDSTRPRRN